MSNLPELVQVQNEVMGSRMTEQLRMVLPDHISVQKFQRVVVTAINKNPILVEADRLSLYTACIECATDGLLPNGKEAALVIFNTKDKAANKWIAKAQYMPMISGIYKRARNSGEISLLNGRLVHQNDVFAYEEGFEPTIVHKPALKERGPVVGAYAVVIMKDGMRDAEWMPIEDIEQVRSASRAKEGEHTPWTQWWGEMAKKTVVRRLAKRLSLSAEVERMIQRVDDLYDFDESRKEAPPPFLPRPAREDYPDEPMDFEIQNEFGDTEGTHGPRGFTDAMIGALHGFDKNGIERSAFDTFVENNKANVARLREVQKGAFADAIDTSIRFTAEKLWPEEKGTDAETAPVGGPKAEEGKPAEAQESPQDAPQAQEAAQAPPAPSAPTSEKPGASELALEGGAAEGKILWKGTDGETRRFASIVDLKGHVKKGVAKKGITPAQIQAMLDDNETQLKFLKAERGPAAAVCADIVELLENAVKVREK